MTAASEPFLGSPTRTFPIFLGGDGYAEAVAAFRGLAEPWTAGDRVKVAIQRAARATDFGYWRAFDIWYGKARRIEEFEYDAIAEAKAKKEQEAARNEFHELRTRMARLESMLVQADQDFHRESIIAVRDQVRPMGGKNRDQHRAMAHAPRGTR